MDHSLISPEPARNAELGARKERRNISVFEKLRAQAKSSKLKNRCTRRLPLHLFLRLVFEIWNFSGAWGLVLGVSLSGGSNSRRLKKEPDCSGSVVTRSRTPSPRRSEG